MTAKSKTEKSRKRLVDQGTIRELISFAPRVPMTSPKEKKKVKDSRQ